VQVLGDGRGGVVTLSERDCSVQRRHQKLIEEAPSPAVTSELRAALEDAARAACDAVSYRGAGTIEFLVQPDGNFYFIEMNTRLQVEHPVTEFVTGVDLVHAQLRVAAGEGLPKVGGELSGHAIEVRINAEDPLNDFMPAPGEVEIFNPPLGPGVRVDTYMTSGAEVPPFYDSLIAKVIVHAEDRKLALSRLARALNEFEILGVPTTRELAQEIIRHPAFVRGDYTTTFLEAEMPALVGILQS
jgi:acetyl-CoA carboxylase biotin carboxylase subunit